MRSEKGNAFGMIKDDRIYQVLLKYNFDLFRGDKNITEYMRGSIIPEILELNDRGLIKAMEHTKVTVQPQ